MAIRPKARMRAHSGSDWSASTSTSTGVTPAGRARPTIRLDDVVVSAETGALDGPREAVDLGVVDRSVDRLIVPVVVVVANMMFTSFSAPPEGVEGSTTRLHHQRYDDPSTTKSDSYSP